MYFINMLCVVTVNKVQHNKSPSENSFFACCAQSC